MSQKVTVKIAAYRLKKQLKNHISYETVREYANQKNFDVFSYSEGWEVITDLKVVGMAQKSNSFIYVGKRVRAIFIDEGQQESLFLLLHELGHYLLGHTIDCQTGHSIREENEANLFAELVLKGNKRRHKRLLIAIIIILVLAVAAGFLGLHYLGG